MISKEPLIVALGPPGAGGVRKVRVVVKDLSQLPNPLPPGFKTVTLATGSEIPGKASSHKESTGFFVDADRAFQDQAKSRIYLLLEVWKRHQDISALQVAYPNIDLSEEIAEAKADLD